MYVCVEQKREKKEERQRKREKGREGERNKCTRFHKLAKYKLTVAGTPSSCLAP